MFFLKKERKINIEGIMLSAKKRVVKKGRKNTFSFFLFISIVFEFKT